MGKKQHQSDKLYLTTTEWKNFYGGHKDLSQNKLARANFRRLPFTHCALSLQPFEHPICTTDGTVFDLLHVVPFIKKHGVNPVTGEKIDSKSLVHLKFHKNPYGQFHCPITFKQFTANSHIVAIRTSGNVYSFEAVNELNIKPKHYKDLLDDKEFIKKDIIHLQDPTDLDKFNIDKFHFIKCDLKKDEEEEPSTSGTSNLRRLNTETKATLKQLAEDYKPPIKEAIERTTPDAINSAHFSSGRMAAGFTSTTMDIVTQQQQAIVDEDTLKYARVKKKGYVRLLTNYGPLNLEIYANSIPKASENFIKHCKNGYYDGSKFHRIIRNFMRSILKLKYNKGGDPSGSGQGGESIWGKSFKDEFHNDAPLSHSGRGVLSMANKGSNTNGSQFFITFRSCKHLDKKHTIFGKVVGGMDTLTAMEKVDVDEKDKPKVSLKPNIPSSVECIYFSADVTFINAQVFVDPFEEAEQMLVKEREELAAKNKCKIVAKGVPAISSSSHGKDCAPRVFRPGVGKYLPPSKGEKRKNTPDETDKIETIQVAKTKKSKLITKNNLNDFSAW